MGGRRESWVRQVVVTPWHSLRCLHKPTSHTIPSLPAAAPPSPLHPLDILPAMLRPPRLKPPPSALPLMHLSRVKHLFLTSFPFLPWFLLLLLLLQRLLLHMKHLIPTSFSALPLLPHPHPHSPSSLSTFLSRKINIQQQLQTN